METDLLIDISNRLARLERSLEQLVGAQQTSEWLTPSELCKLINTTSDGLRNAVRKGKIHGDAIRNVGTPKRAQFRFHRTRAADQYLKKLS